MRRSQSGFTLLEMMVVLVVATLALAVTVPLFSSMTGADLKQASREVSSVIRDTYDQAFLKNRPMRIVWNLDRNAYWVEVGTTEARIFRTPEEKEEFEEFLVENERIKERLAEDKKRDEERRKSNMQLDTKIELDPEVEEGLMSALFSNIFDRGKHGAVHPADYKDSNGFEAIPGGQVFELPKDVRITGVLTYATGAPVRPSDEAPETPEDEMVASTVFFPSGYVEDTAVYLSDEERTWTLLINPLTGRLRIENGEVDLPQYEERVVYE